MLYQLFLPYKFSCVFSHLDQVVQLKNKVFFILVVWLKNYHLTEGVEVRQLIIFILKDKVLEDA